MSKGQKKEQQERKEETVIENPPMVVVVEKDGIVETTTHNGATERDVAAALEAHQTQSDASTRRRGQTAALATELDQVRRQTEDAILGKEGAEALRTGGVDAAVKAMSGDQSKIIAALSILCSAKVGHRLEPALQEVITYLTDGMIDAATKQRLQIIAAVSGCERVKAAIEALA